MGWVAFYSVYKWIKRRKVKYGGRLIYYLLSSGHCMTRESEGKGPGVKVVEFDDDDFKPDLVEPVRFVLILSSTCSS